MKIPALGNTPRYHKHCQNGFLRTSPVAVINCGLDMMCQKTNNMHWINWYLGVRCLWRVPWNQLQTTAKLTYLVWNIVGCPSQPKPFRLKRSSVSHSPHPNTVSKHMASSTTRWPTVPPRHRSKRDVIVWVPTHPEAIKKHLLLRAPQAFVTSLVL